MIVDTLQPGYFAEKQAIIKLPGGQAFTTSVAKKVLGIKGEKYILPSKTISGEKARAAVSKLKGVDRPGAAYESIVGRPPAKKLKPPKRLKPKSEAERKAPRPPKEKTMAEAKTKAAPPHEKPIGPPPPRKSGKEILEGMKKKKPGVESAGRMITEGELAAYGGLGVAGGVAMKRKSAAAAPKSPSPEKLTTPVNVKAPKLLPTAPHPSMAPVAAAATKGQYQQPKMAVFGRAKGGIKAVRKLLKAQKKTPYPERIVELATFGKARELQKAKGMLGKGAPEEVLRSAISGQQTAEVAKGVGLYGAAGLAGYGLGKLMKKKKELPKVATGAKALKALGAAGVLGTAFFTGKEWERLQADKQKKIQKQQEMRQRILQRLYGIQ